MRQHIAAKHAAKHNEGTDDNEHVDSRPGNNVLVTLIDRPTLKLRKKMPMRQSCERARVLG
ncbi:hypothetical protein GCM10007863_03470 [Dyella mobilis]|nr:hypothetical protein GCM10007863_03470 [Dyella mobilis]